MTRHCPTCTCSRQDELDWHAWRERERLAREAEERRKEAEREFAARHSVLSDADVAWARARNAARQP